MGFAFGNVLLFVLGLEPLLDVAGVEEVLVVVLAGGVVRVDEAFLGGGAGLLDVPEHVVGDGLENLLGSGLLEVTRVAVLQVSDEAVLLTGLENSKLVVKVRIQLVKVHSFRGKLVEEGKAKGISFFLTELKGLLRGSSLELCSKFLLIELSGNFLVFHLVEHSSVLESLGTGQRLENSLLEGSSFVTTALELANSLNGLVRGFSLVLSHLLRDSVELSVFLLVQSAVLCGSVDVVSHVDILQVLFETALLDVGKEVLDFLSESLALLLVANSELSELSDFDLLELKTVVPLLKELLHLLVLMESRSNKLLSPVRSVVERLGLEQVLGILVLNHFLIVKRMSVVPDELFVAAVVNHRDVGVRRVGVKRLALQAVEL